MKFVLSMEEIGKLVLTHIETQYGRKVSFVRFLVEDSKSLQCEVEDGGPMPKDTPAPEGIIPTGGELDEAIRTMSDENNLKDAIADLGKRD